MASGVPAEVSGIFPHIGSPAPQTQAIVNDCSLHPLVPELPFGGVQAAALRLDPITDRDEYAALAALLASQNTPTIEALNRRGSARRAALTCRQPGHPRGEVRTLPVPRLLVQ